jgi:hypothetical protein
MSTPRLRGRVLRLEQLVVKAKAIRDPICEQFKIDPELARAIRDDDWRGYQLSRKSLKTKLSAVEQEILSKARVGVIDRARTIIVPAGYGMSQVHKDANRNQRLFRKRLFAFPKNVLLPSEDAENALLTARIKAFRQSPEGCGRRRINQLFAKSRGSRSLTPDEKEELQRLAQQYPPLPWPDCEPIKAVEEMHWTADEFARRRGER